MRELRGFERPPDHGSQQREEGGLAMLRFSMFFLVCALSFGVFGFGAGAGPSWALARALFFVFFALATVSLVFGTIGRPSEWRTRNRKQIAYF